MHFLAGTNEGERPADAHRSQMSKSSLGNELCVWVGAVDRQALHYITGLQQGRFLQHTNINSTGPRF